MLEYLLRTYVIESAEPQSDADSLVGLLQSIKARHDFAELEHLRIRNGVVQVRHGVGWYDLGAPIEGAVESDEDSPAPRPRQPAAPAAPAPTSAAAPRRERGPLVDEEPRAAKKEQGPPPKVSTSKRFRKLEMD